ncbi:MAG: glutamine--fructose-6-phosphate transaminase (isomerizing) [Candidatus Aminicenantes bacterium]|nr:glutamine--fructose-6-phosphate transaminase (isomerizing) [Candidatus Aminicenantes bacterium]NIM77812.1 glutamine--fructose-6-phosphate transaminase (isomerizing) [Candidatus Aminicenantes bacterium]NIN17125.1 glutamine--fructose-6-phosphate transaminase (isomerizing) [Candidatus Aminicenantes bacterium]NIN41018.1 glutamine--fructose-6-phosphate transaminase (isomerizing) [Candidatus Aminicenantes bacterium]NIN83823.1 glutamine--fructose-6-phosphate transaminase (isomerizing) [Candidatus A
MCGIICYCGKKQAIPILINGLKRLEYRGYDSAGFAVVENGAIGKNGRNNKNRRNIVVKAKGRVDHLEKKKIGLDVDATFGIAHTRWATHGKPSQVNAHPQTDCANKISVVHNGIIENYLELKEELMAKGHVFKSETDTEVIAHLVEEYFEDDLEIAVLKAVERLSGTFGIAVIHADIDHQVIIVKRGSPMVVGIGDKEYLAASDSNALTPYTKKMIYLSDDEIAVLNSDEYHIKNLRNETLEKKIEILETRDYKVDKRGFEHYMLKEIFEQPVSIENAMRGRIIESEGVSKLGGLEPVLDRLKNTRQLIIVSCGTSYYAGLLGRYIFEHLTELNIEVELASEFRYRRLKLDEDVAVLALSQSGETADTLAAIKEAKRKGALVLGIVNAVGTAITQITDAGVYNHAGPEIGVASTKIYTSQLVIQTLMALLIGRYQGVSFIEGSEIINALIRLPDQVREILKNADQIKEIAHKYSRYKNFLYIGRLFNYPTAMEGALKLKEISYIHAEGYAAGEMKHGPISLIDRNFPTVAIVPDDLTLDKMISNMQEIKARNGKILSVTNANVPQVEKISNDIIVVPRTIPILQPILNIIPLQLFAYYIAKEKGRDIDKPRNLAKSVTVE